MTQPAKRSPSRRQRKKAGSKQFPTDRQIGDQDGVASGQTALLAGLVIVVALIVLAIHWPALRAQGFSSDDGMYLTNNRLVQRPSWANAGRFLSEILEPSTVKGYYQPLTMISLMGDHAIGGRADDLRPFHRTSLALHVANTALVVLLVYLLFGQPWAAAMVGLLFGLHPLAVDPIAWISERKTLLAAFFAFWCLVLYVGYVHKGSRKLYIGAVLAYVLALMAKPTSTPVPVLLLLLDCWPLRRLSSKALLEKIPFVAIGTAFAVITILSQSQTAFVRMPSEHSPGRIPLMLCHNVIFYLWKVLWPASLSSHYPFPRPLGLSDPMVLAGVIGTGVLLPALFVSLRWTRALLVGWLFFFVAIFPTMGVFKFTNMIASARYLYLPTIGLMLPLAYFLAWLWNTRAPDPGVTKRRAAVLVVVVALATALSVETRRGLDSWRNTETRFRYLLAVAPRSPILHNNFGVHLSDHRKVDEAVSHYEEALRLAPNYAAAHNNLGNALRHRGEYDLAIESYTKAVRVRPGFARAHMNLGFTLQKLGQLDAAVQHFREAANIEPDIPLRHLDLGQALKQQGRIEEAVEHYNRALELKPDYAKAHVNLGNILLIKEAYDQAIARYAEALRHDPDLPEAHCNMGLALKKQGKIDEAIAAFREVVRIVPSHVQAHYNLGDLLGRLDQLDEAIEEYEAVLRINPGHSAANQRLEAARARRDQ